MDRAPTTCALINAYLLNVGFGSAFARAACSADASAARTICTQIIIIDLFTEFLIIFIMSP